MSLIRPGMILGLLCGLGVVYLREGLMAVSLVVVAICGVVAVVQYDRWREGM